ncbi:MAG: hypothetical protein IRY85_16455 [Micromonosporaceae bacterium]|nr:hypothetical protein [Micromonosporaceae bacterium]
MIGLVLSMMKARRAQTVTLFLLAAVSVAAAVAGPVAARAVDEAVARIEVENASGRERTISVVLAEDPTAEAGARLIDSVTDYIDLPGFEVIRGGGLTVFGPASDPGDLVWSSEQMVYRDGVCEHVIIVAGRCLAGAPEILIGAQTAEATGVRAGDVAWVQAATVDNGLLVPDGIPSPVTVVGVYEPVDPEEAYWGGHTYFPVAPNGRRSEAIFISPAGLSLVDHTVGFAFVDALAPPDVLTPDRLERIRTEVFTVIDLLRGTPDVAIATALPDLAQRVATGRELAAQLGPIAFIPLAGFSLFVIYLAVAHGVLGRRTEIAMVALRGVTRPRRWVLATGETVGAILLGAPVGYVLGHLGVGWLAQVRLGSSDGTDLSLATVPYAAAAVTIALAVALLGQRRALREPVVDLLRGVPRSRGVWSAIASEALFVALAVVATVQLRVPAGGVSGLGLLVPGLVMVAVALLAARLNGAVTGLVARFALRRRLLGVGLAAVQLARRPGSRRLFVLLAVGAAVLAFVAAGLNVAARARDLRASVELGAPRVLQVVNADVARLLAATEALDPEGAWSMAVVAVEPDDSSDPPLLAVDTSRLAAVVAWRPEFGADPAAVAAALAPSELPPLAMHGTVIEVDVNVTWHDSDVDRGRPPSDGVRRRPITLVLGFATGDGRRVSVRVAGLEGGPNTRTVSLPDCAEGCRLVSLSSPDLPVFEADLVLTGIRQLDPPADVAPLSVLTDRARWRAGPEVGLATTPSGLRMALSPSVFGDYTLRVGVVGVSLPVPVAVAGDRRATSITSVDETVLGTRSDINLSMLPRLGSEGVLVDLRALEATLVAPSTLAEAEIWLGPSAPADAIDQFRQFGLSILSESTVEQRRSVLAQQGPALALQFHLAAAAFAVLLALVGLGLVAAVERRQRAADLRALRVQGLPRRVMRRAALWGYLSTVVVAALTGLGAAALAWAIAGDRIPLVGGPASSLAPPRWPLWSAVVQPWAAATLAMAVAATVAAWALRRAVARGSNGAR